MHDLVDRIVFRKSIAVLGHFSQCIVEGLDGIGGLLSIPDVEIDCLLLLFLGVLLPKPFSYLRKSLGFCPQFR